jgi:hypothetical protein
MFDHRDCPLQNGYGLPSNERQDGDAVPPELRRSLDALLEVVDQVRAAGGQVNSAVCFKLTSAMAGCARLVAPDAKPVSSDVRRILDPLRLVWEDFALPQMDRSFWRNRGFTVRDADEMDDDEFVMDMHMEVGSGGFRTSWDSATVAAEFATRAICQVYEALTKRTNRTEVEGP